MSRQKIFLYTSEIAAYIGQNKYDYVTPFERLWKRCDPSGYNIVMDTKRAELTKCSLDTVLIDKDIQQLQTDLDSGKLTRRQFTARRKRLDEKRELLKVQSDTIENQIDSIDLNQEQRLVKKLGQESVDLLRSESVETDTKRVEIERKLTSLNLTAEKLQDLQNETTNYINKTHGTLKEDSAIKMYETKYKVKLDTSQTFFKRQLEIDSDNSRIDWYIGGKMDGVYRDTTNSADSSRDYIVEVKNRTKGFFTTLRDYERTQIHLYMYMTGINITKLVEKYKDKIRVTVVYNDAEYTNNIVEYLTTFITCFEQFLADDTLKYKFVSGSFEDRRQLLNRLYINPINEIVRNKILQESNGSVEKNASNGQDNCLIDDLD